MILQKVWDSANYELMRHVELERVRDRRHVAARFDFCCSEKPFDQNHRLFIGLSGSVLSVYPDEPARSSKWPSGHGFGGLVSMQYNKGTEQFYSSGADGVFRVWEYGSAQLQDQLEVDNWDL